MEEPYESTTRPEFPQQIRRKEDLQPGDWVFSVNKVDSVSILLLQVMSKPKGKWITCTRYCWSLGKHYEYTKCISLCDYSILPYKNGWWNCSNFLIPAGEHRTPLTREEEQALVKELGVTPHTKTPPPPHSSQTLK